MMNRWKHAAIVLANVLAGAALTGCGFVSGSVEPRPVCNFDAYEEDLAAAPTEPMLVPRIPNVMTKMPLNHVNVTDVKILHKVLVQDVSAQRDEQNRIKVWTRLVNCTDYPLQVEGRTQFMTEMSSPAQPTTAWQRVYLPARTFGVYESQSVRGSEIHSYLVELREGS